MVLGVRTYTFDFEIFMTDFFFYIAALCALMALK